MYIYIYVLEDIFNKNSWHSTSSMKKKEKEKNIYKL